MSWLLDDKLPLYDWSNSSHITIPSESFDILAPAFTFMNSTKRVAPVQIASSGDGVLPPLTCNGKMSGSLQKWNTVTDDAFNRSNFARSILKQTVEKNLESDWEISNQTCDNLGSGGGGEGKGGRGSEGSSLESDRLNRRREQNRRAAVNCRRKKKERAKNSLMDYQKFQCSNTKLMNDVRQLTEVRNRLLHQLTSICQRCASLASPLPTIIDADVCED